MMWHTIARVGPKDNYVPGIDEGSPRIFCDYDNNSSPYSVPQHVVRDIEKRTQIQLPEDAKDLLHFAMTVYSADRCINRDMYSDNCWGREIRIYFPVADPEKWNTAAPILQRALDFLSGDRWEFEFRKREYSLQEELSPEEIDCSDVCLLSGGLDSLAGAIDLLKEGRTPMFVGHYGGGGVTSTAQAEIASILRNQMGISDKRFLRLNVTQPSIRGCNYEQSMRTRSLLFLAMGCALGSLNSGPSTLFIPENGLISLNVPLTGTRTGSLSTRTTHPHFMMLIQDVISLLGFDISLELPFRHKTKGEMLKECADEAVLRLAAAKTVSCSHPEQSRWGGRAPGIQCGHCLPCLVRRAAIHQTDLDDAEYLTDVISNPPAPSIGKGRDYRAILMAVERYKTDPPNNDIFKVLSTGSIESVEVSSFVDVYRRGMEELAVFLTGSGR